MARVYFEERGWIHKVSGIEDRAGRNNSLRFFLPNTIY